MLKQELVETGQYDVILFDVGQLLEDVQACSISGWLVDQRLVCQRFTGFIEAL